MSTLIATIVLIAASIAAAFFRHATPSSSDALDYGAFFLIFVLVGCVLVKLAPKNQWPQNRFLICVALSMTLQVIYEPFHHMWQSIDWARFYIQVDNHLFWRKTLLVLHIFGAISSTFLGPLLFFRWLRNKYPHHHRRMGKIYVCGTLFSAVTVLPLSLTNAGGFVAQIGFTTMAVLWFTFTWLAYTSARSSDFVSHRRWMMRSYALTFAFVHVNFTYKILDIYQLLELGPVGAKVMQSMVSWMSNLLLVEIYLAATSVGGKFVGLKRWWENLQRMDYLGDVYWWVDETDTAKVDANRQRVSS